MGAMIGDMFNNNDEPKTEIKDFGGFDGGDFGGGGASGSWDNEVKTETQITDTLNIESQLGVFS